MGLSLGFPSCSIDLFFCFVPIPYCLHDCTFVVQFEVRKFDSSSSILLSQDCFGSLGSFVFPYTLLIFCCCCSSSVKNGIDSLIGITLNLWASLVAQMVKNPLAMQETRLWSRGQEDPLQKRMATHSSVRAWEIPRAEGLTGYSPWGHRVSQAWVTKHTVCVC